MGARLFARLSFSFQAHSASPSLPQLTGEAGRERKRERRGEREEERERQRGREKGAVGLI